ncbi:anti-sigma factor domain-containing protein [Polaromonas sp. SM01]|uniref:anti-sigma factor n=1 Tax=Polaromonas sp. SM01 TaxID=3085630 RepID=UPI002980A326|nr:anti-sigma factor [Polaromonas sp. SM01]MDW5442818.1 anti-sigma factor [Polaromonas sp. SM01]
MNLTGNPSLIEQLAASYALGTLRGGARRRFEALARSHAPVRAAALIWQGRMASVGELQPQIAPSPAVWKRIENLIHADQEAKAMLAARQVPAAVSGGGWWASLGLWRGASAAGAMAAVLAVVVGLNLNTTLNGQVRELSAKLAATPDIQYVAVLADDKSAPTMLVTFDPKHNQLQLKRVGAFQVGPDKSLELWALPQTGGPKSLGVLGEGAVIRLPAGSDAVNNVPALAITLEPKGGSPAGGGPTGPVLFKGALIPMNL